MASRLNDYRYRQGVELWMVNNKLVAQQQAYAHAHLKEEFYEVKHYYCQRCGVVWGLRVQPEVQPSLHFFYKSTCRDCGGDANMLTPWELSNIDILGPNVLAYLILTTT